MLSKYNDMWIVCVLRHPTASLSEVPSLGIQKTFK
jgi:hypothetical protein